MNLCMLTDCPLSAEAILHNELLTIFGAALVGLWIGEDMVVDGSNNVTSWPGRVGSTLAPFNAGYYRIAGTINGRRSSTSVTAGTSKALTRTVSGVAAMVVVVDGPPSVTYETAAGLSANSIIAGVVPSNIYADGVPHYVNGIASEVFASGLQIIEATTPTAGTQLYLGGGSPSDRTWAKALCLGALVSGAITPTQRAQSTAALKAYYSIP